jgi:thiol-disulfide isomerase/thioredoxin
MYKSILTNILLVFFVANAFAQGVVFKKMTWAEAQKESALSKKNIFLDAYTTWCAPCKMMEKEVFVDDAVGSFFNEHFVCIKIDMEKGEGIDLARVLNIHAFPTFVFADEKGNVLHIEAGGKNIAQTLEMGNLSLDTKERMAAQDEKLNQGGAADLDFLRTYIDKRFALQNNSHQAATEAFLLLQNDFSLPENMDFIVKYVQNPASKGFSYLLENKVAFVKQFGKQKIDSKIETCIYNELYKGEARAGVEAMEKILQKQYGERAGYYLARYKIIYAKNMFDIPSFLSASEAYFKAFPPEDPAEWSAIALYSTAFPRDKNTLKTALGWVEKGIKQEDNYDCRLAKARIFQYMGKDRKAKKYAQQAAAFAQKNGEDPTKALKLLE